MNINFPKLAQAFTEKGLLGKTLESMTKEEITLLCQIVYFCAQPTGSDDVPF